MSLTPIYAPNASVTLMSRNAWSSVRLTAFLMTQTMSKMRVICSPNTNVLPVSNALQITLWMYESAKN